MSFYRTIFGQNLGCDAILSTLGLTREETGRFRDCFVANGEIAVYTRNGGGNREYFQETIDKLSKHPCYIRDEDDEFDSTYATIYFSFPEEFSDVLNKIDNGEKFDPNKRWINALESLKD